MQRCIAAGGIRVMIRLGNARKPHERGWLNEDRVTLIAETRDSLASSGCFESSLDDAMLVKS
jgi:hypothetical protein